jgi:hypothetical protein
VRTRRGWVRPGTARLGRAGAAGFGSAGQGLARQGSAGPGSAGVAGRGEAWRGKAWLGLAGVAGPVRCLAASAGPVRHAVSLNDQLAKLWAAGQTLSEIEQATGLNRGVVAGRIHRARRHGDPRFQPRPPPVKACVLKPVDKPPPPRSRFTSAGKTPPEPRLLVDLGPKDCKWPVGEAADGRHLFCGLPALRAPYCERHCRAVRSESTSPSASRGSR